MTDLKQFPCHLQINFIYFEVDIRRPTFNNRALKIVINGRKEKRVLDMETVIKISTFL